MNNRIYPAFSAWLRGWAVIFFGSFLGLPCVAATAVSATDGFAPASAGGTRFVSADRDFSRVFSDGRERFLRLYDRPLRLEEAGVPPVLLASNERSAGMSSMFEPLIGLYKRLLAAAEAAGDPMQRRRLQAWLSGNRAADTDLLSVNDILAAELEDVEIITMSADQLTGVGLAAETVAQLTEMDRVITSVKSALRSLPEGLREIPDPLAVGIWSNGSNPSRLVALVMLR